MPVEMNAKKISKIYHGSSEVYEDKANWQLVELGPDLTGCVAYQIESGVLRIIGVISGNPAVGSVIGILGTDFESSKSVSVNKFYTNDYSSYQQQQGTLSITATKIVVASASSSFSYKTGQICISNSDGTPLEFT